MSFVFGRRPTAYRIALVLLFSGLFLFVMGFASPYWYRLNAGLVFMHGGLWQSCIQVFVYRSCRHLTLGSMRPNWITLSQGLLCIGLVGLIIGCFYAIAINWVQKRPSHTRLLEILGILCSSSGLAGCTLFVVETSNNPKSLLALTDYISNETYVSAHTVAWGLYLTMSACFLCLVSSCVLAVYNPSIPEEQTPDVIGYTDPVTGLMYPVVDLANPGFNPGHDMTNQGVYYIPSQPMAGGFQMSSFQQPPPYELVAAQASAPPYCQHAHNAHAK